MSTARASNVSKREASISCHDPVGKRPGGMPRAERIDSTLEGLFSPRWRRRAPFPAGRRFRAALRPRPISSSADDIPDGAASTMINRWFAASNPFSAVSALSCDDRNRFFNVEISPLPASILACISKIFSDREVICFLRWSVSFFSSPEYWPEYWPPAAMLSPLRPSIRPPSPSAPPPVRRNDDCNCATNVVISESLRSYCLCFACAPDNSSACSFDRSCSSTCKVEHLCRSNESWARRVSTSSSESCRRAFRSSESSSPAAFILLAGWYPPPSRLTPARMAFSTLPLATTSAAPRSATVCSSSLSLRCRTPSCRECKLKALSSCSSAFRSRSLASSIWEVACSNLVSNLATSVVNEVTRSSNVVFSSNNLAADATLPRSLSNASANSASLSPPSLALSFSALLTRSSISAALTSLASFICCKARSCAATKLATSALCEAAADSFSCLWRDRSRSMREAARSSSWRWASISRSVDSRSEFSWRT
mmetsp:Transcript_15625/g.33027  ORF Transcript_15625/g.33027 Transcript_15625/m.33027 type:complete len:484 (+) Transcript_15625:422-1873(+)